jgi:hypothetical protein
MIESNAMTDRLWGGIIIPQLTASVNPKRLQAEWRNPNVFWLTAKS